MIDERIRIEYCADQPERDGRERQDEVATGSRASWSIGRRRTSPGVVMPERREPAEAGREDDDSRPCRSRSTASSRGSGETPLPTRSTAPPRLQPEYAPRPSPTTIAISSPRPNRMIVGQRRCASDLDHRLRPRDERVAEVTLRGRARCRRRTGRGRAACRGPTARGSACEHSGCDVRVAPEDPLRRARHHPEQDEVEDDDQRRS